MKIDKSKLKLGIWFEDCDGNMYEEKPENAKHVTRRVCFPLQITTQVYNDYDKECNHPLKCRKRTLGWVDGIKGCECVRCGKTKVGKSYIPFAFMPWKDGPDTRYAFSVNTTLGKFTQKCIVAMVNSGDFELDEALVVMANACERCMNTLLFKYLNGEDGYPEYSEEWYKANTCCDFCK